MSFTFTTSGAIVRKAGANVSATAAASGALLQQFSDDAEGIICGVSRGEYLANYSGLPTSIKQMLSDTAASLAGAYLINYDMNGYFTNEATTMMDVLFDTAKRNIDALKDDKAAKLRTP